MLGYLEHEPACAHPVSAEGRAAQHISPAKLRMLRSEPTLLKMLNLSHELLAYTVPFVLGKINRVSFGILAEEQQLPSDTISRRLLAVPFVGKDSPSRASEFSHPDVVISLTILAFRYQVRARAMARVRVRIS